MLEPATQKTPRARSVDYAQLNGTVTRTKPGEARALASKAMALLQSGKVATQSEACRMVGVSPARLSTLKVETLPAYSGFNAAPSTSVELRFGVTYEKELPAKGERGAPGEAQRRALRNYRLKLKALKEEALRAAADAPSRGAEEEQEEEEGGGGGGDWMEEGEWADDGDRMDENHIDNK